MAEEPTPEPDDDRMRIFVVAMICTAILVGWFLVFRVGVLDDVLPNPVGMTDF